MSESSSLNDFQPQEICFPFHKLTRLLRIKVIEKLFFNEWVLLQQCSKLAMNSSSLITQRIPLESLQICVMQNGAAQNPHDWLRIYNNTYEWGCYEMQCYNDYKSLAEILAFPCRISTEEFYIKRELTSDDVEILIKIVESSEMTARSMPISNSILCSAEQLAKLIEAVGIKSLRAPPYQPQLKEILNFPYIQKLEEIALANLEIEDEQFLLLQARRISLSGKCISSGAINRFLKEWQRGEREIASLDFKFNSQDQRNFEEIVAGVANLVWSPETHRISLASIFHEDEVNELARGSPRSYYVLWRPGDISNPRIIMLNKDQLFMTYGTYVSCFDWAFGCDMSKRIFS